MNRKSYYSRDPRDLRDRRDPRDVRDRDNYRQYDKRQSRIDSEKRRSRSPRKRDKDVIDENILKEISKLPEPNELWDNQFSQDSNFTSMSASFNQENHGSGTYQQTAYTAQPSYAGIYDDFPSISTAPQGPEWNQLSLPPPPTSSFIPNIEEQMKKEAAIESEMRHQKAALSKQREDYIKKCASLKKELETLKDQRNELRGDPKRSPSPDTKRFLKENTKLQLEIQNKLKTINNVVDMLNGIIGEEAQERVEAEPTERGSKRKSRSPSASKKFNYVYYDPEMHWCRVCNEFPATAKDYLNHLHSQAHHKMAAAHMEAPWHTITGMNEGFPNYPSAPTKRTPIKGLQFFVPSTAWYCKLCDQFIGDLHCASAHLKSIVHSKNYMNFVEQNPHWETDWMSDRQKAVEKSRANKGKMEDKSAHYTAHTITFHKEGFHTKSLKDSPPPNREEEKKKDKKKKKSKKKKRGSSSSSSSTDSSGDSEPVKKKKKKKEKPTDEQLLSELASAVGGGRLLEHEAKLLDSLKQRLRPDGSAQHAAARSAVRSSRDNERLEDRREEHRPENRRDRDEERRRDERERGRERDRDRERERDRERDKEKRQERPPSQSREQKKPEIRKMPFIGKMPVYKSLGKTNKVEEQKKEDEQKKKEDDEAAKKRRQEMDAEIQKKVAEFKEKIAKAQLEREREAATAVLPMPLPELLLPFGATMPPPALVHPTQLAAPHPTPPPPAATPTPGMPNLPKDFQDALDIIFPTDAKKAEMAHNELFPGLPSIGNFPGLSIPGMSSFPPLMPQFMGFEMNGPLFPPRPQLYDSHVPMMNKQKPKNIKNRTQNKIQPQNNRNAAKKDTNKEVAAKTNSEITAQKKKEELDDLAMLGIDASDVGAGI